MSPSYHRLYTPNQTPNFLLHAVDGKLYDLNSYNINFGLGWSSVYTRSLKRRVSHSFPWYYRGAQLSSFHQYDEIKY